MDIEKRINSLLGESADKSSMVGEINFYIETLEEIKDRIKNGEDVSPILNKLIDKIKKFKWEVKEPKDSKDFDYDKLRVRRLGR